MIERQLQQARADSSVSKAELPAPPETPPAPRRTLSGKRQPSSNLQVRSSALDVRRDRSCFLCSEREGGRERERDSLHPLNQQG